MLSVMFKGRASRAQLQAPSRILTVYAGIWGLAAAFAILNAMWFEVREDDDRAQAENSTGMPRPR
jgi:cyd operon protein YbgT